MPHEKYTSIITEMARGFGCDTYLELGVYDGENLWEVSKAAVRCIGVDIVDVRRSKYRLDEFYNESTEEFFEHFEEMVDIIFIDADHSFESARRDFMASLGHLNPLGMIILHDTDPVRDELLSSGYCGDSYKIDEWIRSNYGNLDIMTIPCGEQGLTLVKRRDDTRMKIRAQKEMA